MPENYLKMRATDKEYCVNCKHVKSCYGGTGEVLYKCEHPKNISVVTGRQKAFWCEIVRKSNSLLCNYGPRDDDPYNKTQKHKAVWAS